MRNHGIICRRNDLRGQKREGRLPGLKELEALGGSAVKVEEFIHERNKGVG